MKVIKIILFSMLLTVVVIPKVEASSEADRLVASLCDYAKGNNRSSMRKKLKQAHLKLRRIYGGVICGSREGFSGGSLLRISTYYGAFSSAKYISSLIGAARVNKVEKDGQTILQWTQALAASDTAKSAELEQFITLYQSKAQ